MEEASIEQHSQEDSYEQFNSYLANNYNLRVCQLCQALKTKRDHHCSRCDCCIKGYDHHCYWLNICIGRKNQKYFTNYLLNHSQFISNPESILYLPYHRENRRNKKPIQLFI